MRAFRRVMWFTGAIFALAVAYHAALVALPKLRFAGAAIPQRVAAAEALQAASAASQRQTCRVFLVGSSPVLYGLSADAISKSTGCVVVNAAQMAYEEVTPYLESFLAHVRPGDVVVLADRQWTTLPQPKTTCIDAGALLCFAKSLALVPQLIGDFRWGVDAIVHRSPIGDLEIYPDLQGPDGPSAAVELLQSDRRVRVATEQAALIRQHQAIPVLAAVPMLVQHDALAPLGLAYDALGQQMAAALGQAVWLGPQLHTDPAYFVPDAMHASAQGRARWTSAVSQAVLQSLRRRQGA